MRDTDDIRKEVIDRLVKYIFEKLPPEESPLLKTFVTQYYMNVAPEDLANRSILDLYGSVLSHWHFIYQRQPHELKLRVYNPNLEQHGWQSSHTVIEISCDDMPFIVDSVAMELNRLDVSIYLIIHMGSLMLQRDKDGYVTDVKDQFLKDPEITPEAAIFIEIDRQSDPAVLEKISNKIRRVLNDIRLAVDDWPLMRQKMMTIIQTLKDNPPFGRDESDLKETLEFLQWIVDDHFTLLGYEEYLLTGEEHDKSFVKVEGSQLGIFKERGTSMQVLRVEDFSKTAQQIILSPKIILLGKTHFRSTVHRPAYTDFIAIKDFDAQGNVMSFRRFMGLYTAIAYNSSPRQIPYLKDKVERVLRMAGFPPKSHDDRALLNILETLPRDDFFQASEEELLHLAVDILHIQERQRIRLFIRRSTFGLFISCLVFVPKDVYTSELREKMQKILVKGLHGLEVIFSTRFSESSLARIHFVLKIDPFKIETFDVKLLEEKLAESARTWRDDLRDALAEHSGEERAHFLFKRYGKAFPAGYQDDFTARMAVVDIEYMETLNEEAPLAMSLYRPLEEAETVIRFKLFRIGATIPLSDVVPILENMGLRIINERPFKITPNHGAEIWINDYRMEYPSHQPFDTEAVREIFQEAFDNIWRGNAENDALNRLILCANLTWREIMIIRSISKYARQVGLTFSENAIENAINGNPHVAKQLIELFKLKFDPNQTRTESDLQQQKDALLTLLENVNDLSEDKILRRYLQIILAMLRTNYFQFDSTGSFKNYFSFKLDSSKIPEMPLPVPLFEIFVYSPRIEGIHLRAARVARGGIRWSERGEDFRTEILGLMKAQQVKNAVIVPLGAKGGFVVKRLKEQVARDQMWEEIIVCYQLFIHGLLDLCDNIKGDTVLPPPRVVRYDDDDPYFVVAADKGTASFSDIANAISSEYDFWLGDAFASGGSTGYDHKKMGITARGAWESVKNHFHELGFDIQNRDFSVIGIGDMAGDVFGNGMLLSKHIKLIAAFNHMHIFIDPNPDPEKSFLERERLFNLPRSQWSDYNPLLLSPGGGIYLRSAKSITLSKEAQEALGFSQNKVIPTDLIKAILRAPVDLLFNGGIGTYVKGTDESNADVGDRQNDVCRINGSELRCQVVAEGGNLGFTQFGRIEYALQGGKINTDAIDNSGGVNCSDNEVNIKILLNEVVKNGELTEKQRNQMLVDMTDEVSELVLKNNRAQTEAISLTTSLAAENLEMHSRLMDEMERSGNLSRTLEFLPDKDEIATRKLIGKGLTRPEVAVLLAYSKILLKKDLLASDLPEDPDIFYLINKAFPKLICEHFKSYLPKHRLKREILINQLSNQVINQMGITFVNRIIDETGCKEPDVIRAYLVSSAVFKADHLTHEIASLKNISSSIQMQMKHELNRLVRRGARWFLRNKGMHLKISETINDFLDKVTYVFDTLPKILEGEEELNALILLYTEAGVPKPLAEKTALMPLMFSALDIAEASRAYPFGIEEIAAVYFAVGKRLELGWFREQIKKQPIQNHWEAMARANLRDDLDLQQRNLAISILMSKMNNEKEGKNNNKKDRDNKDSNHKNSDMQDIETLIDAWLKKHEHLVSRWEFFVDELKLSPEPGFTMFGVAIRELIDLANMKVKKVK